MSALLIIDMINDFLDPKGALYCGDEVRKIIPALARRLEEFREKGLPVIYLCDQHAPDDEEFKAFPPHAIKGSWGAEVIPELSPKEGEILIPKTRFSGFYRTNLAEVLQDLGVREVHLTGVCTSICVMDTAAGAFYRNLRITVYRDCVGDFDTEMHRFALKRMERVYQAKIL